MHNYKRNILRGSTLLILAVAIVLLILLIQRQRQPNPDSFLCTAKTVTNIQPKNFNVSGSIVLDFKKKRITLQYDIITNEQVKKVLYRDIYINNLHTPQPGVYTFDVDSVKIFATDTASDFLSHFRLLHSGAANEIRITKVGNNTYLYSLNKQIYNVCTAQ